MSDFTLQTPKAQHPARLECEVCYRDTEPRLIEQPVVTVGFGGTTAVTHVYHAFCRDCVEREGLVVGDSVSEARRDQMVRAYEEQLWLLRRSSP